MSGRTTAIQGPRHRKRIFLSVALCAGFFLVPFPVWSAAGRIMSLAHVGPHMLRLIQTVRVGQNPTNIVVNSRAHRVYVLNVGPLNRNYIPDTAGTVTTLATTGALIRTTSVGREALGLAVDASTGRLVVATINQIAVLDAVTGAIVRTIPSHDGLQGVAVAARAGRIFANTTVLDAATGHPVSTFTIHTFTGDASISAVAERAHHVFLANYGDNPVIMLDARSGRQLALTHVSSSVNNGGRPEGIDDMAASEATGHLFVTHSSGLGQDVNVSLLDTATGRLVRTLNLEGQAGAGAQTLDDPLTRRMFVTASGTGADVEQGSSIPPDATVNVLDAGTGRELSRLTLHLPTGSLFRVASRIVAAGHEVMVEMGPQAGPGIIYLLDGRSGTILRSFVLQPGGSVSGLDEQGQHLFVADSKTNSVRIYAYPGS